MQYHDGKPKYRRLCPIKVETARLEAIGQAYRRDEWLKEKRFVRYRGMPVNVLEETRKNLVGICPKGIERVIQKGNAKIGCARMADEWIRRTQLELYAESMSH